MRLASISTDILCHEWPSGSTLNEYKCSEGDVPIKSICWAKDGGWMIVVPGSGHPEIISFNDATDYAKLLYTVKEVAIPTCAAFQNSTKRNIAFGTQAGHLLIYDIKTRSVKKRFPPTPAPLFRVEFTNKDYHIAAGCSTGELFVFNSQQVILSAVFKVPKSKTLTSFRCHPCRKNVIGGGSGEGVVAVWDIHTGKHNFQTEAHRAPVTDLSFSHLKPELFASVGLDRRLCFHNTSVNQIIMDVNFGNTPTAVDMCPDGVGIAVGFQNGNITAFDSRYMKECVSKFTSHSRRVSQLQFDRICEEKPSVISLPEEANEYVVKPDIEVLNVSCDILANIVEEEVDAETGDIDSFLNAMSLNADSIDISDDKVERRTPRKSTNETRLSQNNSNRELKPRRSHVEVFLSKNGISTPLTSNRQDVLMSTISPIIASSSQTNTNVSEENMKKIIREVVQEEMEQFKTETRYQLMDMMGAMQRHFLDLQMSIVKESIKMEDALATFKHELFTMDDEASLDSHKTGPDSLIKNNNNKK